MRTKPQAILFCAGTLVSLSGCGPALGDDESLIREHVVVGDMGDEFDFQNRGPLEFLGFLKSYYLTGQPVYPIRGTHVGWIRESDIAELVERLDSKDICASVAHPNESRMVEGSVPSTEGHEAAFLIKAFRVERDPDVISRYYKGYPPTLHSVLSFHPDRDQIRSWWAAYQRPEQEEPPPN